MASFEEVSGKVTSGLTNFVTNGKFFNSLGWLVVGFLVIGAIGALAWFYFDSKKFNKIITAHSIINGFFYPTYYDKAKSVRLGKGGFEIIYLKKMKTWKLAHGARSGINRYNFYIMPDGYWYPGLISADVKHVDQAKGLVTVITTNPLMRAQYTALEKQIDALHGDKQSFWEKYGQWVMSIAFLMIMGVFVWLTFREVAGFLGSGSALAEQMTKLADSMNKLAVNLNNNQASGLVPAG